MRVNLILTGLLILFFIKLNYAETETSEKCKQYEEILNAFIWSETLVSDDAKDTCYEVISNTNCPCLLMQAYNVLGFLLYNESEYNEAEEAFLKAEELYYDEKGNARYFSLNQNYLGLLEVVKKNYKAALYHFEKSKALAVTIGDSLLMSMANSNLGLAYFGSENFDLAEQLWLDALKVKNPKNKTREGDGYAYLNLARLYKINGDLEQTFEYIKKTKITWLNLQHYKGLYLLALLEAGILMQTGDYNEALIQIKRGKAYADTAEVTLLIGQYFFTESHIYKLLNDETNEVVSLKEALNYSIELSLEDIAYILNRLTVLQKNNNNINSSGIFLTAFERLKEQSETNNRKKISNEKQLSKEIVAKQDGEFVIKRQSLFLYVMAISLLLFLMLILWIAHQQKLTKKLNQKILASHKIIEDQFFQLKEKNIELKNFAYVASHDLKSPLRTIGAFAGLIEKKLPQEEGSTIREYIYNIRQSTNSMTEMITSLLDHSATEKGIHIKENLIKHIIEEVLQNLNGEIEQKRVKIIFNELDQSSIYCDKSKFVQLLQNLISNAITYSKESVEPIIEITTVSEPTSFTIQVKDNGIGIDEAHYSTIFEMFKQLKAKAGTQGSGIGLATCKKIVDLHKGIVSVESKVNEGSVFSITIPQELLVEKKSIQQISQNHLPKLSQAATI